jgi:hypothetical protein
VIQVVAEQVPEQVAEQVLPFDGLEVPWVLLKAWLLVGFRLAPVSGYAVRAVDHLVSKQVGLQVGPQVDPQVGP